MVTIPRIVTGEPPEWLTAHTARNMHEIGPSPATRREWDEAGLALPDVDRMRTERLARVRVELQATGCDAAILYDPLNIRYAVDTTNMSIWVTPMWCRSAPMAGAAIPSVGNSSVLMMG